jgi:hypothetical protein
MFRCSSGSRRSTRASGDDVSRAGCLLIRITAFQRGDIDGSHYINTRLQSGDPKTPRRLPPPSLEASSEEHRGEDVGHPSNPPE